MNPTDVTLSTPAGEKPADERLTYDVPEAGRLLGLSRNSAYAAAKAGLIPVLNVGGRMLVPKAALHQMLAAAGAEWQRAREAAAKTEADAGSSTNTLKGRLDYPRYLSGRTLRYRPLRRGRRSGGGGAET